MYLKNIFFIFEDKVIYENIFIYFNLEYLLMIFIYLMVHLKIDLKVNLKINLKVNLKVHLKIDLKVNLKEESILIQSSRFFEVILQPYLMKLLQRQFF